MAFLMNAWYAAAWSHEIRDKPFRRVLLNQPVVLFRKQNGDEKMLRPFRSRWGARISGRGARCCCTPIKDLFECGGPSNR